MRFLLYFSIFQTVALSLFVKRKASTKFELFARSTKFKPGYNLPDLSQKIFPDIKDEDCYGCNYDLIVFGSGPGGETGSVDLLAIALTFIQITHKLLAAVQAAKNGMRVAVIEKKSAFGGPTGLTSKAVREG
jgi:hypothetical protein